MLWLRQCLAFLCMFWWGTVLLGQHVGDVLLSVDSSRQLATDNQRLFRGTFDTWIDDEPLGAQRLFTQNPGFDRQVRLLPGHTTLPGSSVLNMEILSFSAMAGEPVAHLWYWDAIDDEGNSDWSDNVLFQPAAANLSLTASSIRASATVYGDDRAVPPLALGVTSLTGGIHTHPDFELRVTDEPLRFSGVVLVSTVLSMPGLGNSWPIYFLMDTPDVPPLATQAAERWIEQTLLRAALAGDFDGDRQLTVADIDALTTQVASGANDLDFDVNTSGGVDQGDIVYWVNDLFGTWVGDANLDGEFESGDFVSLFAQGLYETNSSAAWSGGDFDGDAHFGSSDLIAAFEQGGYEQGRRPVPMVVPEPSACCLALVAGHCLHLIRRRTRRALLCS